MRHSSEARKMLRALDAELEAVSLRLGEPVEWSERDRAVLELIASNINRKVDLSERYTDAEDTKTRVKLSAELRLLEAALARLLKQIDPEPTVTSPRSVQASRAARARWDRRRA
ncbi:hypothetical protein [Nocardia paucivorans]|uniref:hypothetical protein n=1 Tax=Nocardia paucivorans TaxID=114259 RepID=UPI0002F0E5B8|nr:hypothetical protein [Nocardia paucivorans]